MGRPLRIRRLSASPASPRYAEKSNDPSRPAGSAAVRVTAEASIRGMAVADEVLGAVGLSRLRLNIFFIASDVFALVVFSSLARWLVVPAYVVALGCAVLSIVRRKHHRLSWILCLASIVLGVGGALLASR